MSQPVRPLASLVFVASFAALPAVAHADVQHVVARGHTLEAIAHRYHVDVKAIEARNHLTDPKHLKPGDTLVIPGVDPKPKAGEKAAGAAGKEGHEGKDAKGKAAPGSSQKPVTYAMRAKTPGVIHAARLATGEDFTLRVSDRRGHLSPTGEKTVEHMLRSMGGLTHPIEPRLVALLGVVSDHFGSRKIEVISGFRPYTPTQHTAHSNHNIGHAVDFRVVGVPNEAVRDFCRSLKNTGCGYYPNSTFVHMDVRSSPAYWIDYSKPGEPPRYNTPGVDADEGTSDVGEDMHGMLGGGVLGGGVGVNPSPPPASEEAPHDGAGATDGAGDKPQSTVIPPAAGTTGTSLPTPLAVPASPSSAPAAPPATAR